MAPRNPGVEPWDDLDDDAKALYCRMQEAFAGFLDHTDDQIGRLVDFLEANDLLDDTMLVLLSDNGASREGGKHGTLNELAFFNEMPSPVTEMVERVDEIGGPNIYNNYPWGWAQVGNTPLRYFKSNTYEGGIRDPLIVHWPDGITDGGGLRDQYHHVSDVLPTILECIGIEAPTSYHGVTQQPVEGTSFRYTFDAPDAPRAKVDPVLRDGRTPSDLARRLEGGHAAPPRARRSTTTSGRSTTPTRTSPSVTTWPTSTPRSSESWWIGGGSRRAATTCCHSTIGVRRSCS